MPDIRLEYNDRQVRAWAQDLSGGSISKAEVAALNKLGPQVRTATQNAIADVRNLKKRRIASEIFTTRASVSAPAFTVKSRGRPISFKDYGARANRGRGRNQKTKGVIVSVTPGKSDLFESAWVSQQMGGHVFERVGAARLPVRKLTGPSIATAMKAPSVLAAQEARVREAWPRLLKSQLERSLAAAARKGR